MTRDSMVKFDSYLKKQGISYKDHKKNMIWLAENIENAILVSVEGNTLLENLNSKKETLKNWIEWGTRESILNIKRKEIEDLELQILKTEYKQLSLHGVA